MFLVDTVAETNRAKMITTSVATQMEVVLFMASIYLILLSLIFFFFFNLYNLLISCNNKLLEETV